MRMTNVKIERFRSLSSLEFRAKHNNIICGPNSCGKSNVLRGLKFAFLSEFDSEKMVHNISNNVTSPNAAVKIAITFDKPTPELSAALQLPSNSPFTYTILVKKNGVPTYRLNKNIMTQEQRSYFLENILIIHVPPIRDLSAGGLDPFKATLATAIRKTRGANSLTQLSTKVRGAIQKSGNAILAGQQTATKILLGVDELSVDVDDIELDSLLPQAKIKFRVNGKDSTLDKLGTGHQSTVILNLYQQIGLATGKYVLYLFEEPDNHLHPTSLRAIADDLKKCLGNNSQAFITTHSPYLINQFPIQDLLPLQALENRYTAKRKLNLTQTDREIRVLLGRFGFKPAEALLAKKVLVVEGPNDLTLVRTLIDLYTAQTPDRQDILVIDAGGKSPVCDLTLLLEQLGANWLAIYDWDAVKDTRLPLFNGNINAATIDSIKSALSFVASHLNTNGSKKTKPHKTLDALSKELAGPKAKMKEDFAYSCLGIHLSKLEKLTQAEQTKLKTNIKRKQIKSIRDALRKTNIWLWSDTPEEILLSAPGAEALVETILQSQNIIRSINKVGSRRLELINILHDLGNQPKVLELLIRELWVQDLLKKKEINAAIKAWIE